MVAFECLAGRRPFVGETAVATALAHLREPIPDLPASVPADLAAVVRRGLAKEPSQRFADGRAFAAALRSPATVAAPVVAPPVVPAPATQVIAPTPPVVPGTVYDEPDGRGWVWPVIAVIAIVAAVVVVFLLMRGDGDDTGPNEDQTSTTPSPSSSAPSTPSDTPSETEDTTIRLDEGDYVNRPLSDVERELADLGLRVDKQRIDNPGDEIEGDVDSVNPTGACSRATP